MPLNSLISSEVISGGLSPSRILNISSPEKYYNWWFDLQMKHMYTHTCINFLSINTLVMWQNFSKLGHLFNRKRMVHRSHLIIVWPSASVNFWACVLISKMGVYLSCRDVVKIKWYNVCKTHGYFTDIGTISCSSFHFQITE